MIPPTTHNGRADTLPTYATPDLDKMAPRGQRIALEWYELGYIDGIAVGRAQVEAEDAARWAELRQVIRATASTPDYATLCERRGQPERAQRQRDILRERGLTA